MKYEEKQLVVSEAWMALKVSEAWKDVLNYCDLGFPLAYASQVGLIDELKGDARVFVEETFSILLEVLALPLDSEYTSWLDMNEAAIKQNGK